MCGWPVCGGLLVLLVTIMSVAWFTEPLWEFCCPGGIACAGSIWLCQPAACAVFTAKLQSIQVLCHSHVSVAEPL
jgi:hypothetical protein